MTIYCYDTEFLEDGKTIDLISIGIVCEDGREYYAVNSDADWDRIREDDWLMNNVVRHLPTHSTGKAYRRTGFSQTSWSWGGINMRDTRVKPKWVIANEVREFFRADEDFLLPDKEPELWAYYAAYDHVALAQLWGRMIQLPQGIPMYTHDLKQEMDRLGIDSDEAPKPSNEHNALNDARWNWSMFNRLRITAQAAGAR